MSKHAALALAALLLAACSPRPVVVLGVPEDSRLRVFYNLLGSVDVAPEHVYQTIDGLIAVEDLPPDAMRTTTIPLLSVEARRFDGCLLASVTQQSWEVRLRPVLDCGRVAPVTPAQQPLKVDPKPQPDADRDSDGIVDSADLCPDAPAGRFLNPEKPGCPDGDRDGDGYPDSVDDCPDRPRGAWPGPGRGCPDTKCATPAPDLSFQAMPSDDKTPRILDARPLQLPAGERRYIVISLAGVSAQLSRVDNPASSAIAIERWSSGTERVQLQIKVRPDAQLGPLSLFFVGGTRLELSGLEVVEAPTRCD